MRLRLCLATLALGVGVALSLWGCARSCNDDAECGTAEFCHAVTLVCTPR